MLGRNTGAMDKMKGGGAKMGGARGKVNKILQHTSTDPTKHMKKTDKKGNMGFMADGELKPHRVSNPTTGISKKGGGKRGMMY